MVMGVDGISRNTTLHRPGIILNGLKNWGKLNQNGNVTSYTQWH